MTAGPEGGQHFLDGGTGVDGLDRGAGRHHLAHHRVRKAHDVPDELAVFLFQDAFGFPFLQQRGHGIVAGILVGGIPHPILGLPLALDVAGQGGHQGA